MTLRVLDGPDGRFCSVGNSASLLLRVRAINGRLNGDAGSLLLLQWLMFIQLRSDSSLASQIKQSEKSRNSRSR